MTSNIAECINGKLVAARELHIFDFLEEVRKMFGRWNCTNRKKWYPHIHNTDEAVSRDVVDQRVQINTNEGIFVRNTKI